MIAFIPGYALGYLSMIIFPLWIAGVASEYGLSYTQSGLISSCELAAMAAAALSIAPLLTRISGRKLVLAAALTLVIFNAISIFHLSLALFITSRLLVGAADGIMLAVISAMASRTGNTQKTFAILQIAQIGSASLFFLIAAPLMTRFGSAGVFGYYAAFAAICAAFLWFLPREIPTGEGLEKPEEKKLGQHLWRPLGPIFFGLALLMITQNSLMAGYVALGEQIGLSIATISMTLAITTAVAFLGSGASHYVGSRIGVITPILGGTIVMAFVALILGQAQGLFEFAGATALSVFVFFFFIPHVMGELARLDSSGKSVAIGQVCIMVGAAAGPAAGGAALAHLGATGLTFLIAAGYVASGLFLISAAMIGKTRPSRL